MFFPRTEARALQSAELAGLRLSLNSPVIDTEDLPTGPARAGIAVHRLPGGGSAITVAVRSMRTGECALYALSDVAHDESALVVGLDAALSFAEGMGFLFDDDELEAATPASRTAARERWRELLGETDDAPAPLEASGDGGRATPPARELMLDVPAREPAADSSLFAEDDVVPPEEVSESPFQAPWPEVGAAEPIELVEPLAAEPAPAKPAPPPPRRVPLTKFRRGEAPGAGTGASAPAPPANAVLLTPHGPALGRLQLVKRKRGGNEAPAPSWLQRLLSAF